MTYNNTTLEENKAVLLTVIDGIKENIEHNFQRIKEWHSEEGLTTIELLITYFPIEKEKLND